MAPETSTSAPRATIPILTADGAQSTSAAAIEKARGLVAAIEAIPLGEVTPDSVLDAWDNAAIVLEDAFGPISILNSVHPEEAVRNAGDDALVAESGFMTELFQNERFYERVLAVKAVSTAQKRLQKDLLESFEDSGVSLPADKRLRFREISERLTELAQLFAKNIRENSTTIRVSPDETEGLPESYLQRVRRDADGSLILGFEPTDYLPFMMNAASEEARKRYYIAHNRRGTEQNLGILDEIVALRKEIADLYGVASFAHYVTRRHMVENPETVARFLDEVRRVVIEAEVRDLAQLSEVKAELTGVPASEASINRWDMTFYRERLRSRRFAIDQEELRSFFPTAASLSWMLDVSSRLYSISFEKVEVPVWHEDVVYYDVSDSSTGDFIGGIYLDLYPRDGKYRHAAAWPVRGTSRKAGRTPINVLVTNLDRTGLTHDELETLLHEFGHVLHGVLSSTEYVTHSGTSVERDFVEAPSQMYEEWANRIESLSLMKEHCAGCPEITQDLVDRLVRAKHFGAGIDYGRQLLYASFDMSLTGEHPQGSLETWREMELQSPMGHVEGTAFPGTFEHIASGYAAGYYGYMWAKAIALDMVSTFGADLMAGDRGRRFREIILSRGSEEPAKDLVERFLGRPVSSAAFFAHISGA